MGYVFMLYGYEFSEKMMQIRKKKLLVGGIKILKNGGNFMC